ncbi:hypothetical protein ACFQ7F_41895 [Streptomyces sp. NPDC056486]|uniref:hypothetical protein n=1 Tax=Streptomyces sp. NPDC056486 TaxID=3345835 RepID=UPI00368F67A3
MATTPTLEALRDKAEKSQTAADADKAALLKVAVKEAIRSTEYGHLTAVSKRAGITSQYLRHLVEEAHPGWLAKATEQRQAEKRQRKGKAA